MCTNKRSEILKLLISMMLVSNTITIYRIFPPFFSTLPFGLTQTPKFGFLDGISALFLFTEKRSVSNLFLESTIPDSNQKTNSVLQFYHPRATAGVYATPLSVRLTISFDSHY